MPDLLIFHDLSELNWPQFFAVYRESSEENAAEWYPELSEEEAFEELKDGLGDFTRGEFDELILNHDLDWAYVKGMR